MTDLHLTFERATNALITALQAAQTRLDGTTFADVEDALGAYREAEIDQLRAQGGPYPVAGRRGWTWLDYAQGGWSGHRTPDGELRCPNRAADPAGSRLGPGHGGPGGSR